MTTQTRSGKPVAYCGQCGEPVHGQFVRALQKVYHLDCFRCKDCNKVVATKFFPVEDQEGQYPLCERDYFARLDLICSQCNQALRSSYITACGMKFHVEHFTCSECDTVFGPNDSYYEHGGRVYCHYHYSTKFAVKCVGCETAILKQFVEMNRNGKDECWHPECYMISKFWNVRLASKNFTTPNSSAVNSTVSLLEMTPRSSTTPGLTPGSPPTTLSASPHSEVSMTPEELKERQEAMEMKVQQIWHVLSGYEESSAALIGDMLRAVNGRQLLDIILLAERFILHVEALFAVIDDLEAQFALAGAKGMSHAREAKQLCRKLVNLFSMMSQISPNGSSVVPNNQELFNLITQLAHYLKILIRIALTGSIKLERDLSNPTAMTNCLGRLNLLAMDGSDATVVKRDQIRKSIDALTRKPQGYIPSTQGIAYGYRSLADRFTGSVPYYIPPEGCAVCRAAIEEDCIRLGMFNRWHCACVDCMVCGEKAIGAIIEEVDSKSSEETSSGSRPSKSPKRQQPRVDEFYYEVASRRSEPPDVIYCQDHRSASSQLGFASVSRLEQYAFLLHIALRRLYVHFRIHHDLPSVRGRHIEDPTVIGRADMEVKRMKSVTLDRKLSSTARIPQRSTVVESPAGRMANANGTVVSARSTQPQTQPSSLSISTDIADSYDTDDPPVQTSIDVLRPPFARNNTSVMIVNEPGEYDRTLESLAATRMVPEDDAITLGDIPMLADQSRSHGYDGRPLLSDLSLLQSLIIRHFALLQLQKTGIGHLIELDDVLELLDARKGQWWNKIFKGNAKKDQKKKGVFGVPIEVLVEKTGSDSQLGASNAHLRVPEIIEDIISTMRQMDMAVEGIFRKNGNIRRLQQLSEALDKDSANVNLSEENPVQLAALLKRFLRELPDPLLTFRLHKLFCAAASLQNVDDRRRCLHLLVTLLPRSNRDTMEVLFVFLRWVASFSYRDEETGSKMDLPNLATVITPSILYAKGVNAAKDESFIGIQAVQELLESQDDFYHVPSELMFVITENIFNIFAKELDLPPKEIHRHCSKYMQARGPSRTGGMGGRSSDPRLSVHRSDGTLASLDSGNTTVLQGINVGSNGPISQGQGQGQGSQFRGPSPGSASGQHSRPTSWIQHSMPGSQNSLHQTLVSPPSTQVAQGGGTPWRGPFQGSVNGSRNSSRGSAPSSPGPDERERKSFQLERERAWTPNQDHR
ncbi:hypothetical protein TREMEDRAFT_69951 [Tremella mesenterica DSM 1558]|uniref:uncharacterized protein n=1 Tax=Tremella mesenterica (strain ATCC 24925 / CBS 8224 / DSM 1558 / NBRC 9311 / NRRL Y-6157 / RJB 2259-6 / UBC 559-6) TaxID=578456 RepID=UPI0003F495D0|nr:uncharacterized protein TREMEDRAFT_69951 [Tremella mesenterica DSM 1558]EIW67038.1 hypothetical protein TREMEDRAFT_69951 [Tremella mesenterica DSM 1558]